MSVIAIDGPGGAGKSTVAAALAERLGIDRLDTGAMYRAVTLEALRRGISTDDAERLAELARAIDLEVNDDVFLDGEDVSKQIRSPEVDANVSAVSAHAPVRAALVERQRAWIAQRKSGVIEGRDIGTVVAPNADVKIFLTAHADVRARRRAHDHAHARRHFVDLSKVRSAIEARDRLDSTRFVSPLVAADDAVLIDSSERSVDSIVEEIAALATKIQSDVVDPGSRPVRPISWRARLFYAACRALSVGLSRILLRGPLVGKNRVPKKGAFIFAPLHRSDIDFLIVARITHRRLRFLAKAGIFVNRPFSWLIETLGAFPVHRETTDRRAFERSLEVLRAGEPLVLFPEGTRNSGPLIGPIREGAAYLALRAGVPIVPVGLAGTERALPKGSRLVRPGRIAIVVGEPILTGVEMRAHDHKSRVPRSAVRALAVELADAIQRASNDAAALLAQN